MKKEKTEREIMEEMYDEIKWGFTGIIVGIGIILALIIYIIISQPHQ